MLRNCLERYSDAIFDITALGFPNLVRPGLLLPGGRVGWSAGRLGYEGWPTARPRCETMPRRWQCIVTLFLSRLGGVPHGSNLGCFVQGPVGVGAYGSRCLMREMPRPLLSPPGDHRFPAAETPKGRNRLGALDVNGAAAAVVSEWVLDTDHLPRGTSLPILKSPHPVTAVSSERTLRQSGLCVFAHFEVAVAVEFTRGVEQVPVPKWTIQPHLDREAPANP